MKDEYFKMIICINFKLYAIGGFDGENRLNSVECYHPENNEWTDMPSMKYPRSGAGVAVLNQVKIQNSRKQKPLIILICFSTYMLLEALILEVNYHLLNDLILITKFGRL